MSNIVKDLKIHMKWHLSTNRDISGQVIECEQRIPGHQGATGVFT